MNEPLPGTGERSRALLVIPCFEESKRFPAFLEKLSASLEIAQMAAIIRVVDDGSSEVSREVCQKAVERMVEKRMQFPRFEWLALPGNQGKGAAVRAGWNANEDADILAFVDADGALPAYEVVRLLELGFQEPNVAFFASRIRMLGKSVDRDIKRHLLGRVFATLVGTLLDSKVYDSQCGLKVLPTAVYRRIAPYLRDPGFSFDLELLNALNAVECPIREIPVDWREVGESKVRLVRDSIRMLVALIRLRLARQRLVQQLKPAALSNPV